MELTQNSISARLYRWFYTTNIMPSNLCPYFWKLVLMYLTIIPYAIITLPLTIIHRHDDFDLGEKIILGFLSYAVIFFGFLALYAPITYIIWGFFETNSIWKHWQISGFITLTVTMTIALMLFLVYYAKKRKEAKRIKHNKYIWDENGDYIPNPNYKPYEPKPNLIVEFVKAKYQKYCTKINWK